MKSIELKKQGLPPTRLGVVGFTLLSIIITGIATLIIITAAMFILASAAHLGADPGGYVVVALLSVLIGLACSIIVGFFISKLMLRIVSEYQITNTSIVFSLVNLLNVIAYGLFTPIVVVSVLVKQKLLKARWIVLGILGSLLLPVIVVGGIVLDMRHTTNNAVGDNNSLALPQSGNIDDPFGDGKWSLSPLTPVAVDKSDNMVDIHYRGEKVWIHLEMHNDNFCSKYPRDCTQVATLKSGQPVYKYSVNNYLVAQGKGSWVITRSNKQETPDLSVKIFEAFTPATYKEFNAQIKEHKIKVNYNVNN